MQKKVVILKLENLLVLEPIVGFMSSRANRKFTKEDLFTYKFYTVVKDNLKVLLNQLSKATPKLVKRAEEVLTLIDSDVEMDLVVVYEMPCQVAASYLNTHGIKPLHLVHLANAEGNADLPGISKESSLVDLLTETDMKKALKAIKAEEKKAAVKVAEVKVEAEPEVVAAAAIDSKKAEEKKETVKEEEPKTETPTEEVVEKKETVKKKAERKIRTRTKVLDSDS